MNLFILDNSITMRWLLNTEKRVDQFYAEQVLESLRDNQALVPNLWHLEVINVLVESERRAVITAGDAEHFINQLEHLPIQIDTSTAIQAFNRTLALARSYKLSSYDAAYLELAIREGLAIATLDKQLIKIAKKLNVPLYLKG